jgi:hypothetical protein
MTRKVTPTNRDLRQEPTPIPSSSKVTLDDLPAQGVNQTQTPSKITSPEVSARYN